MKLILFSILFLINFVDCEDPFPFGLNDPPDPFSNSAGLRNRASQIQKPRVPRPIPPDADDFNHQNEWGFEKGEEQAPDHKDHQVPRSINSNNDDIPHIKPLTEEEKAEDLQTAIRNAQLGITTTDLPPDPRHNGLLKDVGTIGVGFGVGVGVPGNDPVSVGTGVSVGLGESGPAGGLPWFLETVFPRPGEQQSLNDYDGNKELIVSGKAYKYIQAARLGFIKVPQYAPAKSLVGVNSGIGILGAQAPTGG